MNTGNKMVIVTWMEYNNGEYLKFVKEMAKEEVPDFIKTMVGLGGIHFNVVPN